MNFPCTESELNLSLKIVLTHYEVPGEISMEGKVKTETVHFVSLSIRFDTIFLSAI